MTASISFVAALINDANFFVPALYDASNVGTVLESQQVPKTGGSYTSPFQVTFLTNLQQNKVYRCILWESPDATPTGVNRVSGDFKASLNSVTMRGDLYLTGGSSVGMVIGTSGYIDPANSLSGWSYDLEQVGYGTLQLGIDYTVDPTTGNWTLINGTTIGDGQKFVVHFQPQISAAAQPPVSQITSGTIITANTTLDASYKNKALYIQGANASITCPLPGLSTLADYDYLVIYSSGGSHINALFPTIGTDKIQYRGLMTQLVLGQGETLKLFKANGVYNVDGPLPGVDNVGQFVDTYLLATANTVLADGRLLDRTQYARLYAWATAVNAFVSETAWGAPTSGFYLSKGFYTQGTSSSNFRIPDLRVYGSVRAIDGSSRGPGSFQQEMIGQHDHTTHGKGTNAGSGGPYYISNTKGDASYSGGGHDPFGRSTSPDTNMRTDNGTGTEQRLNNTGVFRLIKS